MPRLKLTAAPDDKPVRITIDLPAETHRMLAAYAEAMARESGQPVDPVKLVSPMIARFILSDRAFKRRSSGAGD
jgi:hypothetical protein